MNYTEKYHLPQWEESDRVMRTDFNQMCAGIETGLVNAQATADQGLVQANTLPYAVGGYVGTGEVQSIALGFRPSFIIVSSKVNNFAGANLNYCHWYEGMTCGKNLEKCVQFTDTGFTLPSGSQGTYYPALNEKGNSYEYIAFK